MKLYKEYNKPKIIDRILCRLHWHVLDRKEENAYLDGCDRPHAWCKFCYAHIPLFGYQEKRFLFGRWRRRNLIKDCRGNKYIAHD